MPSQNQYLHMTSYNAKSRSRGGRRPKEEEEHLNPDETEKRKQRRLRNKEAAARCRQRRLDQMQQLQLQVEGLEDQLRAKQDEIDCLKTEKSELEYLLRTHECKMNGTNAGTGFASLGGGKLLKKVGFGSNTTFRTKEEPTLNQVVTNADIKMELLLPPHTSTPTTTLDDTVLSRPTSLILTSGSPATPGVPTETPSNGLINFDLLGMPTGLTPSNTLTHFLTTTASMLETPTTGMDTSDGVVVRSSLCQL